MKKVDELRFTNDGDLDVSSNQLKSTFLGDYNILALRKCCTLKFLHALEINQTLLAHTQGGAGSPTNILIVKR